MNTNDSLAALSEQQLLERFAVLVHQDRVNTAELLTHIAEIDERKLWAKHACPSINLRPSPVRGSAFCMERFHMSESMTAKRLWAARTARRFPVILAMVARGDLHLSAINQLAKHLTEENHRSVLDRAKHKSSREIDLLVAELAPRPDVPSRMRALPGRTTSCAPTVAPEHAHDARGPTPVPAKPAAASKQIVALAPRRYKIEITVDQDTHDKLRSLQDLLRHQLPSVDPAMIVSRAIHLLLEKTLRKKAALTKAPRPDHEPSAKRTRAIPATVRREVWKRDRGRCAFVDAQGRRCRATSAIEYHHEMPYGKGGSHELANIALRCRSHNQYQADLDYGRAFILGKRRGSAFRAAC